MEDSDAPHRVDPRTSRDSWSDGLQSGNYETVTRLGSSASHRSAHAHSRRARDDCDVRFLRKRLLLLPALPWLIATYVSSQNDCYFCQHAHGAVAAYRLAGNEKLIDEVKANFQSAPITDKLKALLVTGSVQNGGKQVTSEQVERARSQGATDKEIHDAVLIAAAFCVYNRYVDGLATWAPTDPKIYGENLFVGGNTLKSHAYRK
jgi:AhpD family alkylhydroperoxidase